MAKTGLVGLMLGGGLMFAAQAFAQTPTDAQPTAPGVISHPAEEYAESKPQSALDMVERTPGFTFEKGGQEDPSSPTGRSRGNVLIDGQPPSSGEAIDVVLKRIAAANVLRIDVIRGGRSDTLGHAIVANVVVRRAAPVARPGAPAAPASPNRASVTGSVTAIPRGLAGPNLRVDGQKKVGQRTVDGSLSVSQTPSNGSVGYRERRSFPGGAPVRTNLDSFSWSSRGEARAGLDTPLGAGRVRLNGVFTISDSENRQADTAAATGVVNQGASFSSSDRLEGTIRYSRAFRQKFQFESRYFQQATASESESVSNNGRNVFTSQRTHGDNIAAASLRYERSKTLAFETGGETAYVWQSSLSNVVGAERQEADRRSTEAYASSVWKPKPELTVEGGVRLESTTVGIFGSLRRHDDFAFVKPRVAVIWAPDRLTQVNFSVERQVEPVNIDNYSVTLRRRDFEDEDEVVGAAQQLSPETLVTVRARYQKRFGRGGLFAVEAIHQQRYDIVDRVLTMSGAEIPGNTGDGRRETMIVSFDAPLDEFGVKGGVIRLRSTVRDSELIDYFTGERRRVSGEQPWSWEVRFSHDVKSWAAKWGMDVLGGSDNMSWRRNELSMSEVGPNVTLYVEHVPIPDVTLRAEVRNLTDRSSSTVRQSYSGGRQLGKLTSIEDRFTKSAPVFFASVRRTF